jgi:parvulin-like peptidyl-prolyl isomerase
MIPRRFLRPLALVGVLAFAAATTSCSSTMNDAATVTYKDKSGTHTVHVTRDEFESELKQLLANKQFVQLLHNPQAASPLLTDNGNGDDSTDADLAATWLTTLVKQQFIDGVFKSLHLSVSPADTAGALNDETGAQANFGSAKIFEAFGKSLQNKLLARDARRIAVSESCESGKAVGEIVVKTKAQSDAVLAQLRGGADFATLAKAKSLDKPEGQLGGLIGCVAPGFFGQFQQEVESAPLNTPFGPIKTGSGYHVLIVSKWDPSVVNNSLIGQQVQQAANTALSNRLEGAKVWIDPRFGTWQSQMTSQGLVAEVVPPNVPNPRDCRETTCPTTTTTTTIPLTGG